MRKQKDERVDRSLRRIWLLISALIGALITTGLVTVVSVWIPSADDSYGAPLTVGRSCAELFFPRCKTTFSWLLFAFDVLINWALWFALARWSGIIGVAAGIIGALVSVLLIPVMLGYEQMLGVARPIVGLPIPLGWTPIPSPHVTWLDILAWAAAAAALTRLVRKRLIARRLRPE